MAVVVGVKVMMVALNFTLIALAARALDAEGFGYYSILFSAAGLLLIVGAAGQELFVIRSWNEYAAPGDVARAKGALRFSAMMCVGVSTLVAALFYAFTVDAYGPHMVLAVTAFVLVAALLQVTSHLIRTAIGVAAGDGIANLLQIAPALVYLAACLSTDTPVTVSSLFIFLTAGSIAGLMTHLIIVARLIRRTLPAWRTVKAEMLGREWLHRSWRLLGANTLEATNQHIDVLVIGLLMSPAAAGAYFVTVRVANLFAAAADAINLFATRHFSRLYQGTDRRELEQLLDSIGWITLGFLATGFAVISAGGYFALRIIDEAYADNFPALLILCLGTAALAIARPSGSILMLTGHEGRYLATVAGAAAVRMLALFALAPSFGVMGAVVATALSFTLHALVLRRLVVGATGLDATVLRLLRARPQTKEAVA